MKLGEIYELAIAMGMDNDPRGKAAVEALLERERKQYEELKEEEREAYDRERLRNPYSDTRILYGSPEHEVRTALVGIDVETAEILLADRLREKGRSIDLVLGHHPEGRALADLFAVMHLQEDVLARFGVPINVAEGILASRISEVQRGLMPLNHFRPVDAARLLDLPFMCVHTAADNLVTSYLQRLFDERGPERVEDVLKLLREIPEYRMALAQGAGPTVVVGKKENRAGKVMVDMTGGTSGSPEAYEKLAQAGVGTVVGMHIKEEHRKEAEKHHINVVIAGHMASDSLGLNLFLDELARRGVEIIPFSGLIRVARA
ncbi:NGG1p interacting factor NIF3 [Desulfothermobacter acidiphilus]|uniref:NGG1p interacting factor NIF3 n=1 Tax=Desulfothermobacter acidiphilus TaxID=1938353 RepID=UPI003F8BD98B